MPLIMKKLIVSIKDELSGFRNISFADSEPIALRDFTYAVNSTKELSFNSVNYSLWALGCFDTETGIIDNSSGPRLIVTGDSILRKEN